MQMKLKTDTNIWFSWTDRIPGLTRLATRHLLASGSAKMRLLETHTHTYKHTLTQAHAQTLQLMFLKVLVLRPVAMTAANKSGPFVESSYALCLLATLTNNLLTAVFISSTEMTVPQLWPQQQQASCKGENIWVCSSLYFLLCLRLCNLPVR